MFARRYARCSRVRSSYVVSPQVEGAGRRYRAALARSLVGEAQIVRGTTGAEPGEDGGLFRRGSFCGLW